MVAITFFAAALAAASSMVAGAPVTEEAHIAKRYSGQATYFYQNGNPGACGKYNSDSAYIVAVNANMYDGSKCGSTVKITNQKNGKSITAKVADLCPGCGGSSLDLSVGAFEALGDKNDGVLPISWNYQ